MLVKRKIDNVELEVLKLESGNYMLPNGAELSKADMTEQFIPIKPKVAKEKELAVTSRSDDMSDDISSLAKDLCKANGQMTNGKKDKEGYGYSYMTLGNLSEIVRPVLAKNNLAVMQTHNSNGKTVTTHTKLIHSSGQWITTSLEIPLVASKQLSVPQQVGVICTYSRRYALQAMFMIVAEDDNDGKVK